MSLKLIKLPLPELLLQLLWQNNYAQVKNEVLEDGGSESEDEDSECVQEMIQEDTVSAGQKDITLITILLIQNQTKIGSSILILQRK